MSDSPDGTMVEQAIAWHLRLKDAEERAWVDQVLDLEFIDTFRYLAGADAEQYSWWSNRGMAREKNVGWRLDYQFATPNLAKLAHSPIIHKEPFFSDHAPVVIDYNCD